jgi:hypothetical protein
MHEVIVFLVGGIFIHYLMPVIDGTLAVVNSFFGLIITKNEIKMERMKYDFTEECGNETCSNLIGFHAEDFVDEEEEEEEE